VNLTVTADGAEGVVNKNPFNLNVTPGPDGMVVNGLIGGAPSTVTISKSRINGALHEILPPPPPAVPEEVPKH